MPVSKTDREKMTLLLAALKEGNDETINSLACDLFIDKKGDCNWDNIRLFEIQAKARIFALERDSFGWLVGGIKYEGKTFSYG